MKPCTRVGLDVTWKCNATCKQCFYLRNPNFHNKVDIPLDQLKARVDEAKCAGCDHAVYVGFGEPSLYPDVLELTEYCHSQDMTTSMITNGLGAPKTYEQLIDAGMNHFHISSHGIGDVLDETLGHPGAFEKQETLKRYLRLLDFPYRTNTSMQQLNYKQLEDIAHNEIKYNVFHFVFLGFLPHYEWVGHVAEVAVHPGELRPEIERAAELLLGNGTHITIRYQPLCHLKPELWPYVTNARYVYFDPWEWNYTLDTVDPWGKAVTMGDSVACQTPCNECSAFRHCGGWNRTYAEAFDGADLQPIKEAPEMYKDVWGKDGGIFDLNPANSLTGTILPA